MLRYPQAICYSICMSVCLRIESLRGWIRTNDHWRPRPVPYQTGPHADYKCRGQESNLLARAIAFLFTITLTIARLQCLEYAVWMKRASLAHSSARSWLVGLEPTIFTLSRMRCLLRYQPIPSAILSPINCLPMMCYDAKWVIEALPDSLAGILPFVYLYNV